VVVSVNGRPVTSNTDLTRQVALAKAGDNLKLGVIRDGRQISVDVRSGTRPSDAQLAANDRDGEGGQGGGAERPQAAPATTVLGLGLVPLTDQTRARLGVRGNVQGLGIDSVASGSYAAKKTLRRGDVLVRVGETNVTTVAQAQAAVAAAKAAKRPSVLVLINRGGRPIFLPLKLDDAPAK
jgi:serine protease Do